MKTTSHFSRRLMLAGIVLGLLFPLMAITVDLYRHNLPAQWSSLYIIFNRNPVQWIVATAPIVLCSIFYALGRLIGRREDELSKTLQQEKAHSEAIRDILTNLYQADQPHQLRNDQLLTALEEFKVRYRQDREKENQQRWSAEGMAQLNQLLYSTDDVDELSKRIISFLVKYCKLNHGALFVLVERHDDRWLEMKSRYANGLQDGFAGEKSVTIGEGLVGQCFEEGNNIILDTVPSNYLKISSGLGESDARCLIILPLKNEIHIEGVLEMAGFHKPAPHVLAFLDQAVSNMASTLHNIRMNGVTRDLLEESQQQTEEMRAQEEEMRQTMEELAATQEDVLRKEREYIKRIEELEATNSDYARREWEYKHQLEQLRLQLDAR